MALIIIFLIVLASAVLGMSAKQKGTPDLEHWSVGGRNFGAILVWILVAGEVYTTFSFLGASGWVYGKGAPAYYILTYITLAYVISYYLLPPVWRIGKRYSLLTQSDFFTSMYGSRSLGVLVAVIGIAFMIPYLQLQLTGLGLIVDAASGGAVNRSVAMVIAFILVASFVYLSGVKGNAWVAFVKDAMMIIAIIAIGVGIPYHYFGGIGPMFDQVTLKFGDYLTLPGHTKNLGIPWYISTSILTSVGFFMWPHLFNATFTAKEENVFRKNAVVLPIYQLGLLFVFFVGFSALLVVPGLKNPDMSLLEIVKKTYPAWVMGFIGAAGALTAMVPAANLLLSAATAFSKNILKQAILPDMSDTAVAAVARWSVIGFTALALFFAIIFPSALVNLLLIGYDGVTQFLPGVFFAILGLRFSPLAVGLGMLSGVGLTVVLVIGKMDPYMGVNAGFLALLLNFAVTLVVGSFTKNSKPDLLDDAGTRRA
ncbi:MAG: sodium:solute symporter family protein [Desulfitobacteriaceae bacterium]